MPARAKQPRMNIAMRRSWTQEEFFAWAQTQEGRYEFDGFEPVDMTGGTLNHAVIISNTQGALRDRLKGTKCRALGSEAGVATIGKAVRYPDALVTCAKKLDGSARTTPGVVVVFEVISPSNSRTDRIEKVREYAAVSSIRRYVIVESEFVGLTVHDREAAGQPWRATTLENDDMLQMPEVGIEIPVAELYEGIVFKDEDDKVE